MSAFMLSGSVCLITGASRGIGAAIARAVCQAGAKTVINYYSSVDSALALQKELTAAGGQALAVYADVSNASDVNNMFLEIEKHYGGVDVLINNAGVDLRALITDIDVNWERVIDVNLKGTLLCCQRAVPNMIHQKKGRIINIASIFALCGAAYESIYAASKGGLIAFTKSLASELAPSGITVNAIAPGPIKTAMLDQELDAEEMADLICEIPVGRLGQPEEIAAACLYLLSSQAGFINGHTLTIDGGWKSL